MTEYLSADAELAERMPLTERQLLQSVVEIARYVFGAAACSVFLIDARTGELVFEAVAGEGAEFLPGTRFPAGTGIAGWVAASGEPALVEDVGESDVFAIGAARQTGYVPSSLMAAPLVRGGRTMGVLEVLDPSIRARGPLADLDLLGLLGTQAAISLDLLLRSRRADVPGDPRVELGEALERLGRRLGNEDGATVSAVASLVSVMDALLAGRPAEG